jgi:hypothetical protein
MLQSTGRLTVRWSLLIIKFCFPPVPLVPLLLPGLLPPLAGPWQRDYTGRPSITDAYADWTMSGVTKHSIAAATARRAKTRMKGRYVLPKRKRAISLGWRPGAPPA